MILEYFSFGKGPFTGPWGSIDLKSILFSQ